MIRRPCESCGALIPRGRLCTACLIRRRRQRQERLARTEPAATEVWRSSRWERTRTAILARDRHTCQHADATCSSRLEVHHKVRPDEGGAPYDPANLITLCVRHHRLAEARQ